MKLSALTVNTDAIEQGRWIGPSTGYQIPELGDVELKVRGLVTADYRTLYANLVRGLDRSAKVGGMIAPAAADRIVSQCLLETVLLDWRNLSDDDGKPITYSKRQAEPLLNEPEFRRFRDGVVWAASIVGDEADVDTKADEGN